MEQRDRILEEAEHLFLGGGFDTTTVDLIVSKARISKSDFYAHFQNRDDVFLAVARQLIMRPNSVVTIGEGALLDRLVEIATDMRTAQVEQPGIGILRAAIVAKRFSPDVARQVYLARASRAQNIAAALRQANAQDGAHFDDADLCAYRFAALATEGLRHLTGTTLPRAAMRRAFARYVVRVFLYGYGGEEKHNGVPDTGHGWITPQPVFPDLPVTRKAEDLWATVLDQAWELFRRNGYSGASIEGISERAGIPKNTIYRRFGSKTGLFLFTARRRIDLLLAAPLCLEPQHQEAVATLLPTMLDVQMRFCSDDCMALSMNLIATAGDAPEMTSTVHEYLAQQVIAKLAPVVDLLMERGAVSATQDRDLAAWHIYVLASFGSRYLFVPPESDEVHFSLAREAAKQFLFGIFRPQVN